MDHPPGSDQLAAMALQHAIRAHGGIHLRRLRRLYTEVAIAYHGDGGEPRILRSWLDFEHQQVRTELWHRAALLTVDRATNQAGSQWSPAMGLVETAPEQAAALRALFGRGVPGLFRIMEPLQFRGEETWFGETGVAVHTPAGRAYLFDATHTLCGERVSLPGQPEETLLYRDVQLIDGIWLPHTVDLYSGPDHVARLTTLTVKINGDPLPEAAVPADHPPATLWRLPYATPLTLEAVDQDACALLRALWRPARIIALGEATHGTHEFFTIKHQLVVALMAERKDIVFAIEANMPEADRINQYILEGRGDPQRLIKEMQFWTWDTQEVLDMIEWMRTYNASGHGRIEFTGFDMQFPAAAMEAVLAFLARHDPALAEQAQAVYADLSTGFFDRFRPTTSDPELHHRWTATMISAHDLVTRLESRQSSYLQHQPPTDVARIIQYARLAAQAAGIGISAPQYRDRCLADNVGWLAQQHPAATLVLWAHNIHVMRTPSRMGGMLAAQFGDAYCPVGFTFYAGSYVAVRADEGPVVNTAAPALASSSEARLYQSGHRGLIIDLQRAATQQWTRWLLEKRPTRNIGAFAVDGHDAYALACLPDLYAALIFIARSTPSQRLTTARGDHSRPSGGAGTRAAADAASTTHAPMPEGAS
jgi:erythromycin esterase